MHIFDEMFSFSDWTLKKYNYGIRRQKIIFEWNIFYCDLGHNIEAEKNKTRPVLIIQRMRDYVQSGTVIVAPITNGKATFKHEINLDITKYNKVKGIIDLSQIRVVSRSRLDEQPKDRLLNEQEYLELIKEIEYNTIQEKVKKALRNILALD